MSYFLAIKDKTGRYKHYKVPEEVYIYVKQLENAINYNNTRQALVGWYPERFNESSN